MISITKSRMGVKIEEVWFSPQKCNDKNVDVIKYCQTPQTFKTPGYKSKTLVTDLTVPGEEMLKKFNETTRRKIKEGSRENIDISIKFSDSITDKDLEEFVREYHLFIQERGLSDFRDESQYCSYLKQFSLNGNLTFSTAAVNGQIAVRHAHIHDENIARLLVSFSHFRNDEAIPPALISRANCCLHYREMLEFKNRGLQIYDWGGISNKPELENITYFKRNFKGTEQDTIYVKEGVSLKGKLALAIEKHLKSSNDE